VGVPPRRDRIDFANPTFEQMARQWFDSFRTNPSDESFAYSRSRFLFCSEDHVWFEDRWMVATLCDE
jgi:hypothetical protein